MDESYRQKLTEAFKEECEDLLSELEESLLALEKSPNNTELIAKIFRALHTIKGSGAMAGFNEISEFTHSMETVYDFVRNGNLEVSKQLIDTTLMGKDYVEELLKAPEPEHDSSTGDAIISEFEKITGVILRTEKKENKQKAQPPQSEIPKESVFYIEFKPSQNIFLRGINPDNLLNELGELGRMKCRVHTGAIPDFAELNPENCYLSWSIELTTDRGINAVKDVFIFTEGDSEIKIREGKEKPVLTPAPLPVSTSVTASTAISPAHTAPAPAPGDAQQSIRVNSDKLDSLVNLVGEMIIAQARFLNISKRYKLTDLMNTAEEMDSLLSELRETVMKLRMIPIKELFGKYKRLVRDLSDELNKKAELITIGEDTELDKNIIERLQDPLMHIIRNSIDHGIETPEKRKAAGKKETGSIILKASYSGAYVLIEIEDDGAGIDKNKIIKTALGKGIISSANNMDNEKIYSLIFRPGFSTADRVTNLSGRGVGMDVVKKVIESMGGSVSIASSPGTGTSITLKIPLTLAIIEGMLIRVEDSYFIIPLSTVSECVEFRSENSHQKSRNLISLRGKLIPYIKLRDYFGIGGETPKLEQMVITYTGSSLIGFVADEVEGQYQTVIKSLGAVYRDLDGISGATILGDGRVALILDVLKLAYVNN